MIFFHEILRGPHAFKCLLIVRKLSEYFQISVPFLIKVLGIFILISAFQKFMDKWHTFGKRKFGRGNFFLTKIVSLELKLT